MDYGKTERMDAAERVGDEPDREVGSGWPVVIRPQPLRLADLEARIAREAEFARAVATRRSFAGSLARAVWTRDPSARLAWSNADELAERLVRLAVGAKAPSIT